MLIGLIKLISTQKVLKTCYKHGSKYHYLSTNHSPNRHIDSPLAMKEREQTKQDQNYVDTILVFQKECEWVMLNPQ